MEQIISVIVQSPIRIFPQDKIRLVFQYPGKGNVISAGNRLRKSIQAVHRFCYKKERRIFVYITLDQILNQSVRIVILL